MKGKSKILIAGLVGLISVAGFAVAIGRSDDEQITDEFRATTDGSFFRKHLMVAEDSGKPNDNSDGDWTGGASQPTDFDVDAWERFFKASKLSETRTKILLEGLDCKRKGVIYHQLRPGYSWHPGACAVGCSAEAGSLWYSGYENNFDFATQAAHNIEDPLYLDCSYFVKHCYWAGGIEMASSNTSGMGTSSEWVTITREQLVPGDIAVKAGSHVVMFVAFDANGTAIWIEMSGHKEDCKFSAYEVGGGYIYRRFSSLMNDTEFVPATGGMPGGSGSGTENVQAGVNEVSWSDSWEFAKAEMKHPDKLNKYVPDNWNGKTVFLNPGHGDGTNLASNIPNDPLSGLQNQYSGSSSAGHTSGTSYKTTSGKEVSEAQYVLDVCNEVKTLLLAKGYAVIMARESLVNNFENSARSVFANNTADIHVAVHINSGTDGPAWFRASSAQQQHPNVSQWYAQGTRLGESLEQACSNSLGKPPFTSLSGTLTGYCYSKIPCAYIELFGVESREMGDFADTHMQEAAKGVADGIANYFGGQ